MSEKALKGITVLDFTQQLSGPFASKILGDLGAEIIKIEKPEGDDTRTSPPFLNGEGTYFMSINRGKKSIILDLKNPEHKQIALELAAKVDVVMENGRPGVMKKLGLDYEEIKKINPKVIYASISGFGQDGPYRNRGGLDIIIQAMSGLMSVTGEKGGRPVKMGPSISDMISGCYAAIGVLAAINYKQVSGEGQYVDVSMLDSTLALMDNFLTRYTVTGNIPKPAGNRHTATAPFQPFETLDGEIIVCVINNKLWESFCKALGKEELIKDERFIATAQRVANVDELGEIITSVTKTKTTDEWERIFDEAAVPYGTVNTMDRVVKDPQVTARNMIVEMQHPVAGTFKTMGTPLKMSKTPIDPTTCSPTLGQHTREVLKDILGKTDSEIDKIIEV
ncbi:MAG: carnitine dehydratase [Sporomusa sp.]|jgi:CoA:oxalate CoA-transferase|nr:carnitine dehydratase [Sporomusa sp.]